ncbi:hypothetical protein ACFZBU_47675 [Embleya sp. NPDC008237]|uniref:hypothetical protein n=1 Tax=Embleya sp. NPDC008237 TaxID=3363978 RepID=UPI0036EB7AA1
MSAANDDSLAAAIRWAWTGATPATDRFAGPHASAADVLEDIASGRRRIPLADARPWADPDLEAVIEEAMNLEPAERATAGALAAFGATRA